jgi:hypothetical protein
MTPRAGGSGVPRIEGVSIDPEPVDGVGHDLGLDLATLGEPVQGGHGDVCGIALTKSVTATIGPSAVSRYGFIVAHRSVGLRDV